MCKSFFNLSMFLLTHLVSSTEPTFQVSAIMNSASSAPNDAAVKGPSDCNEKASERESAAKKGEAQFVFHVRMFLRRLHQLTFYNFSALHFPAGETGEEIWSGRELSPQPFTYVVNDFILLLIS